MPISHGEIGTDNAEEILALGAVLKNNSAGGTTGTSRHGAASNEDKHGGLMLLRMLLLPRFRLFLVTLTVHLMCWREKVSSW